MGDKLPVLSVRGRKFSIYAADDIERQIGFGADAVAVMSVDNDGGAVPINRAEARAIRDAMTEWLGIEPPSVQDFYTEHGAHGTIREDEHEIAEAGAEGVMIE
jgi:hypothetical protein